MATPLPLTSPSAPAGSSFSMATPLSSALYPTSVSLCGGSASAVALSSDEFQALGLQVVTKLCRQLLESGFPVLHFYTLNLAHVVNSVLKELGLGADSQARRALPWRQSMCAGREKESVRCGTAAITVACMVAASTRLCPIFTFVCFPLPNTISFLCRPIFWANRPKTYIARTESWDKYPEGQWGTQPPLFTQLSETELGEAYPMCSVEERRAMWGDNLLSVKDVYKTFARYVSGGRLACRLPSAEYTRQE